LLHTLTRRGFATSAAVAAVMAASALTATAASADPPLKPLKPGHGRVIEGQYIVVLNDDADGATVARRTGVSAQRVYTSALKGFSARLSASQLRAVRRDSSVKYVEPDALATVNKPSPQAPTKAPAGGAAVGPHTLPPTGQTVQTGATWGIDRVDQRNLPLNGIYRYTSKGNGVTAYIIDTGIYTAHSNFGGRAVGGFTSISDGNGTNDCHGHGTHVAGTVGSASFGVAKGVRLVGVRVLDCGGSGSWSGVIAGIDYVSYTHQGPSVANMSLGGGYNQAVNDAVTNSINEGVTYAVAAGNNAGLACNTTPASTPLALTVGATDINDNRAGFSNYGACVDVFDPGVNIKSLGKTSTTATAIMSGTSMASPHVAGLAALFLQTNPTAAPATVNAVIKGNAVPGVVGNPGAGSPNLLARKWNGALSGTGASSYEPDGTYWTQSGNGYIRAWLEGTAATDPDLYLLKWNGSAWVIVAASASTSPRERIAYNGTAGFYMLQAYAYSGAGTYDVWSTRAS
jgi:subtilisin family serine protease